MGDYMICAAGVVCLPGPGSFPVAILPNPEARNGSETEALARPTPLGCATDSSYGRAISMPDGTGDDSAFSGRLRGVLAGARGTWAGVVLGHRTAVLEVMPQVGQPRCGIVSKSTVGISF